MVRASGPRPTLAAGANEVALSCEGQGSPAPRMRLTVFTRGEAL
jgi:hypothetical protein